MRMLVVAALVALSLSSAASAQVNDQLRDYRNTTTEAAPRAGALVGENILNGTWTRTDPQSSAVLVMQTGAEGALTGTYGGRPCTGIYEENRFALWCPYAGDFVNLITGRARTVELSNSARSRLRAQTVRIEGSLTYVHPGIRPDNSSERFNAERN